MPALLIYIPTYNRYQSLRLCLERILAEINGLESEVVIHVSDNHSSDETPRYLESIQHPCLQWSRNDSNIGAALNIIKVHSLSSLADFTFMLGDDDFLLKDSVRRLVSAIRGNPEIDFFFLNTLAYAEDRLTEVINKLFEGRWSDPPPGATIKSSHPTDTRCLLSDLFSPGVDEVLGGSMMCFSFRSRLVSDHIAKLIPPADQGTTFSSYPIYTAYPHTLNWIYSLTPQTPSAFLAQPFTVNFWHGGKEWGKLGYHRVVAEGLGFVLFEQMRLGYVEPSQFDEYINHYLNISRASILMLLREAEKTPDVAVSLEFKNRLIRVLLGERR
jgi:glycosyltransferase involved in cell wall biosynthesis